MGYTYQATEVSEETYTHTDLGTEFNGGVLVDGICDRETNALVLVTRHEDAKEEQE